ncbi:MAG: MYG1 family protein [Acidocella sp.]|nr:MYG1 family protein [Acidocella sp.]
MSLAHPLPVLATHSGKFHCDEVFAYAVLRLALGLHEPGRDHVLLRTRKPELIETADIVWDVGGIYDAAANRFDHHQRGAPLRADETPFSSAGLVWQVYGERAVTALLQASGAEGFAGKIAAELDDGIVRRIDEIDNGVSVDGPLKRDTLGFASLIGEFNPTWDHPAANGPTAGDEAFLEATSLAEGMLRRRVDGLRARLEAESIVLGAHQAGEDSRLLVLDRGMPWKSAVFSHELPVIFAVSPASNGNWMLDTMPPEPGSFAQRLPLPEAWAGLQAEALAEVSGVPDAVFVHLRRFVGAAKSREGAIALARKALAAADTVSPV